MMKYERPIMNISMFKLESVATTDPTQAGSIVVTNLGQAQIDGKNNIAGRAQRAMVVIRFNDGTNNQ